MSQPTLTTPNLILRPYALSDASYVAKYAGDEGLAEWTSSIPHPYDADMAQAWIRSISDPCISIPPKSRVEIVFAVESRILGHVIGSVGLTLDKGEDETAEIGFWIGKPYWKCGFCTEAAKAVLQYGFISLNLNCIYATHFTGNIASGKVLLKLGMSHEGILRQRKKKNGEFKDSEAYSILKTEFFRLVYRQTLIKCFTIILLLQIIERGIGVCILSD